MVLIKHNVNNQENPEHQKLQLMPFQRLQSRYKKTDVIQQKGSNLTDPLTDHTL